MKAKDLLVELFNQPSIAEDCNMLESDKFASQRELHDYMRRTFGENVCEIIANVPQCEIFGHYMYGYSGEHIVNQMPDIILIMYSEKASENGKCVFLWKVED